MSTGISRWRWAAWQYRLLENRLRAGGFSPVLEAAKGACLAPVSRGQNRCHRHTGGGASRPASWMRAKHNYIHASLGEDGPQPPRHCWRCDGLVRPAERQQEMSWRLWMPSSRTRLVHTEVCRRSQQLGHEIVRCAQEVKGGLDRIEDVCGRDDRVRLRGDFPFEAIQEGYKRTCRPQKVGLYLIQLIVHLPGSIHDLHRRLVERRRDTCRHIRAQVSPSQGRLLLLREWLPEASLHEAVRLRADRALPTWSQSLVHKVR